jgi:hypothetical protein
MNEVKTPILVTSRSHLRIFFGMAVTLLAIVLFLAAGMAVWASPAAAAPASHFGYNLSAPADGGDAVEIQTLGAAQASASCMDYAGYSPASWFKNNSGLAVYNQFANTSIWHSCFHGIADQAKVQYRRWDPGDPNANPPRAPHWVTQYIAADPAGTNTPGAQWHTNGATFYLNKLRQVDITRTLLAVFQHCHSSNYKLFHYPDNKYNLPGVLWAEKGVDTAVGFHERISAAAWEAWNNPMTLWANQFFYYLSIGGTVGDASDWALQRYFNQWGDFGGYDSIDIFGNRNLRVVPARWGSS